MGGNSKSQGQDSNSLIGELEQKFLLGVLRAGDILLYSSNGFFGKAIKLKTSSPITHVAVYAGNGKIREARENNGVQEVGVNFGNLVMIRRPKFDYDLEKASEWFEQTGKHQEYDYWGLVRSFVGRHFGVDNSKVWCSEFVVQDARAAGGEPVAEDSPGDAISPGDLLKSAAYRTIWRRKDFKYGLEEVNF